MSRNESRKSTINLPTSSRNDAQQSANTLPYTSKILNINLDKNNNLYLFILRWL